MAYRPTREISSALMSAGTDSGFQDPFAALVFEGLALHDVAPVAGGVADAQQDWAVLFLGAPQRLFPPGEPVHRVVGMLQ